MRLRAGHDSVAALRSGVAMAVGEAVAQVAAAEVAAAEIRTRTWRVADNVAKRALEVAVVTLLLVLTAPLFVAVAIAIKLDSRGPVFYRCRRVGFRGREIAMLKFRKMKNGVTGPALTAAEDDRFTRVGSLLARTKLDELPQLWNVLKGEMSLVGPRPEDPSFVATHPEQYVRILQVKPGMTGLCQLAFAKEADILDVGDMVGDYVARLLPQKVALDVLYAGRRSLAMDLRILAWTIVAVLFRRDLAVNWVAGRVTIGRSRAYSLAAADGAFPGARRESSVREGGRV